MQKKQNQHIKDYARPIYERYDREGIKPPQGCVSWIDYLNNNLEVRKKE